MARKPRRFLKFVPTEEQRNMPMKEWQEITPQTQAILDRLQDARIASTFIKKQTRAARKLAVPKSRLVVFPEVFTRKDLKLVDRLICRYVCSFRKYRVRKSQAALTKTEWLRFIGAVNALHESGIEPPTYQEFVDIHVQAMTTPTGMSWGAHGASNFLPWHREYLHHVENRLRLFNPLVTIPYWDWSHDALPAELSDPQDMANWDITRNNPVGPMPTPTQVTNSMAQTTWDSFRTSLEAIHNAVHVSVGGQMGGASSPADPLFWLHHAFIDKIWADWQKINPTLKPANLSDALQPTSIFNHTVGQVQKTASLGYIYL